MTSTAERRGKEDKKKQFLHVIELSWYKFKLECYHFKILNVTPMVTANKIVIDYAEGNEKRIKYFTTKRIK